MSCIHEMGHQYYMYISKGESQKTTIKRITKQIQLTELNNSPKSKQNHFTEPIVYKCWIDWLMAFTMAAEYPTVSASVS